MGDTNIMKFTDEQKQSAKTKAMTTYQAELISQYLFGAESTERETLVNSFISDTKDGAYLIINGVDSKVNDKGELTTTGKDGNIEIWEGAHVFSSLTWKTDKDGNVTETRNFYRAPINVDTWVRCERVVNSWIDYANRKYQGVLDTIAKRREKVQKDCDNLCAAAAALIKYTETLPENFIKEFKETFEIGERYGYIFSDEIKNAFTPKEKEQPAE